MTISDVELTFNICFQRRFQQKHLTESKKNIIQTPSIGVKENIQIKVPEKKVPVAHDNLKTDFSVKGKVHNESF